MVLIWIDIKIILKKYFSMLISEKITVNAPIDTVWEHLKTLQGAEQYLPIVTKSEVKGQGLGTTRICDIQMGEQSFQIMETLVKLDDSSKSLTLSIDNGPPPLKDLKIRFVVSGNADSSELQVAAESDAPEEGVKMIQNMASMICSGLKKHHEK